MKKYFISAFLMACMLALVAATIAFADVIVSDGDVVVSGVQGTVNLGDVVPGAVLTQKVSFSLMCSGNKHVDNGQIVSLKFNDGNAGGSTFPGGGTLSATDTSIGSIPSAWPEDGQGNSSCPSPDPTLADNGDSTVTIVAPSTAGVYSYIVKYAVEISPAGNDDPASVTGSAPVVTYSLRVVSADTTKPTISAAATTSPNGAGWYNADVVVHFTCYDADSGIPAGACPADQVLSAEGAAVSSVAMTVTDAAGNISDPSNVVTVSIDKTQPTISAAATSSPNPAGWYASSVTVHFTCADGLSGIPVGNCPADQVFGIEGAGITSTAMTVTDTAGNLSSLSNVVIMNLDLTGPSAVLAVTAGTAGTNGWYTSDVTVSTSGTDSLSGPVTCSAVQYQTTETAGVVFSGSCTNAAGFTTAAAPLTVKLDKTGPSAVLAVTAGTAGTNGWYTSDVTVSTSGTDSISGPVACSADQSHTAETTGAAFNGSCTNDAGLSTAAAPLTVKLDKTGPSAVLEVTVGTPGANGWYTSDVTVSTAGEDLISGPVVCSDDQYQTVETTGAAFNGSCTNDAGLSTNAVPLTVKLDKTGPSAVLAVTAGTAGTNGWYTSDVTVSTSGTDLISGLVACTADQTQTAETTGAVFNGSCTNNAGLTTAAAPLTVKLDKTGPSAGLAVTAGTPGANGWYTSDVTVSTSGTDSISSPVACTADQTQTDETAGTTFNGSCKNDAGLSTAAAPLTVKLDKTGPSAGLAVTAGTPGANGWYTSDVTVSTSGTDSISSPVACTDPQQLTLDSPGMTFNGDCTNDAGLTTSAASLSVKRDATRPTITWIGGPANGGFYYFGFVPVEPTCAANDALSGPNGCSVGGYMTTVGTHTMTATAYDKAGNAAQESRIFTVLAWSLKGFYQPVDMNGVYNTVKNGSTVPLKFEIFAGTTELIDVGLIKSLLYVQTNCDLTAITDDIETLATGGTALRYDSTGGQFVYNWKTPSTVGKCYRVTMTTQDGSSLSAYFKLK